jgi:uncharacterized protein
LRKWRPARRRTSGDESFRIVYALAQNAAIAGTLHCRMLPQPMRAAAAAAVECASLVRHKVIPMTISMYQASAPRFVNMLNNLAAILDKAQTHVDAKKLDAAALIAFRLYPDMFPFSRQVQVACDSAKGAVARLAGVEIPKHEDTEQTFAELKARIAKVIAFIGTIKPMQIDGSEDKDIVLKLRGNDVTFKGMQFLLGFAYPNFYFHVTTAYDILRHNGVELGKQDFIGRP